MFQVKINYTPVSYIGSEKFEHEPVEKVIDLDTNIGRESFLDALEEIAGYCEHTTRIFKGQLALNEDEEFELEMLNNAIKRALEHGNTNIKFGRMFITILNKQKGEEETMTESFAKELKEDLKHDLKIFKSFKKKDWLWAIGFVALMVIGIILIIEGILIWG